MAEVRGGQIGAIRSIQYPIDNSTPQDSVNQIPSGNVVIGVRVKVSTAYSGGAAIWIGNESGIVAFMETNENKPQAVNDYEVENYVNVGAPTKVRTVITGAPASGAGVVTVFYAKPKT